MPAVEVGVVGCFLFYFSVIYHGGLQGFELRDPVHLCIAKNIS